jgi:hypothetical protein
LGALCWWWSIARARVVVCMCVCVDQHTHECACCCCCHTAKASRLLRVASTEWCGRALETHIQQKCHCLVCVWCLHELGPMSLSADSSSLAFVCVSTTRRRRRRLVVAREWQRQAGNNPTHTFRCQCVLRVGATHFSLDLIYVCVFILLSRH